MTNRAKRYFSLQKIRKELALFENEVREWNADMDQQFRDMASDLLVFKQVFFKMKGIPTGLKLPHIDPMPPEPAFIMPELMSPTEDRILMDLHNHKHSDSKLLIHTLTPDEFKHWCNPQPIKMELPDLIRISKDILKFDIEFPDSKTNNNE